MIASDIKLKLRRDKQEFTQILTVASMPEVSILRNEIPLAPSNTLSISVVEPTQQLKDKYQISTEDFGVIVTDVAQGSDAEAKGIKVGDFITHIDKNPILTPDDLQEAISNAHRENNRPLLLLINNNNIPNFASVKL